VRSSGPLTRPVGVAHQDRLHGIAFKEGAIDEGGPPVARDVTRRRPASVAKAFRKGRSEGRFVSGAHDEGSYGKGLGGA
jgi:hypothetical protein